MDPDSLDGSVFVAAGGEEPVEADLVGYVEDERMLTVIVPASILDSAFNTLKSAVAYTVTVATTARTAAGEQLAQPVSFRFETLEYRLLYDDSTVINDSVFGIAYHAGTDTLFYDGMNDERRVMIRRYDLAGDLAGTVVPNASTQVTTGGVDLYGDTLFLNETYESEVTEYTVQSDGTLTANGQEHRTTSLSVPADTLREVQDTALLGDVRYFTTGRYTTGDNFFDIIAYDASVDSWSVFRSASTYGFDNDRTRELSAFAGPTMDYLYLAEDGQETIYRFSTAGGYLDADPGVGSSITDLAHDESGNLYVGTYNGVYKLSPDLKRLDARLGLPSARVAVKDTGDAHRVFFVPMGAPARIGYVDF
jgi:hypothetical protein